MSGPGRLRRSRGRGYRMPEGAVYVGRPTRWGNPFPIGVYVRTHAELGQEEARRLAVKDYENELLAGRLRVSVDDVRRELRGKDLVCWCRPGEACHADVLLRIANEVHA